MHTFTARDFKLPILDGLSEKQTQEHLTLYQGYVKHANLINEKIATLADDPEKNSYTIAELRRRFGFEFDGMRMHEYFFEQFEGGSQVMNEDSSVALQIANHWPSYDAWKEQFISLSLTRGIGWGILAYDKKTNALFNAWVGDHEIGQLAGVSIVLALDMWEHAFMVDYLPSEKKQYIAAFFKNINWKTVETRME
jgi:superoxide dismutase, Fe-Mn family